MSEVHLPIRTSLQRYVYEQTHGDPPDRTSLNGSDDKWRGYLLGVDEALRAAESWYADNVALSTFQETGERS